MNLLLLETSTKNFSLAVARKGKILCRQARKADKTLSSAIVPAIRRILVKADLPLKAVEGFAVGLGPGSFTSLRVGLSTVKALALATGKPLVGISSLDVLAANGISAPVETICPLMDARRDLVYACLYSLSRRRLARRSQYLLVPVGEVLRRASGRTLFLGDGVDLYRKAIEGHTAAAGEKAVSFEPVFARGKDNSPQAAKMLEYALDRFDKKDYDDIGTLVPLYLYPEDCQVRR